MKAVDSFSATFNTYSAKLKQAAQSNREMEQSVGLMERSVNRLQQAFSLGIAGALLNQVKGFAEDMNQLGVEVHANRVLFNELTDEIGGGAEVLATLRAETGGVVDDLALMSGASQLLRLNIVDNNRDLGELVGNIQRLKSPTESTTDAIQNFALMLSNESLLRLDSFGISSANVKRRMDELGQSFRDAVMAEMAGQVARLGDAANVSETALARFQTRMTNFFQQGAENFAIGLEATINLIEVLADKVNSGEMGDAIFGAFDRDGEQQAYARGVVIAQRWRDGFESQLDPVAMQQFIENALKYLDSADLQNLPEPTPEQLAMWAGIPPGMQGGMTIDELKQLAYFTAEQNRQMDAAEAILNRTQQLEARRATGLRDQYEFRMQELRLNEQMTQEMERQAQIASTVDPLEESYQRLSTLFHEGQLNRGSIDGLTLFSPEDAALAAQLEQQFEALYEQAQRLNEQDLITDDELNRFKDARDDVKGMADDIERGANALRDMNLDKALGLDSPDRIATELASKVMEAARQQDLPADQLEALRTQLDLMSGNQTEFSVALDDYLSRLASSGAPIDEITQKVDTLAESLRAVKAAGLDNTMLLPGNINFLAGGLGEFGGVNPSFDINSYLSSMMLALQTQVPPEGFQSAFGINPFGVPQMGMDAMTPPDLEPFTASLQDAESSFSLIADSAMSVETHITGISDALGTGAGEAQKMADLFDTMLNGSYNMKLNLDVVAPDWLKPLLEGGQGAFNAALTQQMATATKANGGTPPGQQATGRSTTRVVQA